MSLYVSLSKYMSCYGLIFRRRFVYKGKQRVKTLGFHTAGLLIGWRVARVLSINECKQVSDWLLASPRWAA